MREKSARVLIYSTFFAAGLSLLCLGSIEYSKITQTQKLISDHLIPQYQFALEMDHALQFGDRGRFIELQAQLIEALEPDQPVDFVEAISLASSDSYFLYEQLIPQIESRIQRVQLKQKSGISRIAFWFPAGCVLIFFSFIGLAIAHWKGGRRESLLEQMFESTAPAVASMASKIKEFRSGYQQLQFRLNQASKNAFTLSSTAEELQKPLNQMDGVVGLINDMSGEAKQETLQISAQLDRVEAELRNATSLFTAISNRTSRMRALTEGLVDLADQTNLFLVNSSMEVAREASGSRGFSMVATEVSHLAEGSTKASQELTELIQEFNRELMVGSQELEREIDSFSETREKLMKTDQTFRNLIKTIDHLSEQATFIETSIGEITSNSGSLKEMTESLQKNHQTWQEWIDTYQKTADQVKQVFDRQGSL